MILQLPDTKGLAMQLLIEFYENVLSLLLQGPDEENLMFLLDLLPLLCLRQYLTLSLFYVAEIGSYYQGCKFSVGKLYLLEYIVVSRLPFNGNGSVGFEGLWPIMELKEDYTCTLLSLKLYFIKFVFLLELVRRKFYIMTRNSL